MKTIIKKFRKIALIVALAFVSIGYFMILGPVHNFNNNYISYFMIIVGIVLIVLFGILLFIAFLFSSIKFRRKESDMWTKIREGSKFKIDLDAVRIKSNNWDSSRFIESHFYDIEIKEHNLVTILEFDVEIRGKKETFHWPSEMEPKSLEMYFAIQRETTFYLDPADHTNFYLDLSFIRT